MFRGPLGWLYWWLLWWLPWDVRLPGDVRLSGRLDSITGIVRIIGDGLILRRFAGVFISAALTARGQSG